MKVKVSYTVQRTEEVEVDDKFQQLTESGGWYDLTYKEQDKLTNELLETDKGIIDSTQAGSAVFQPEN